MRVLVTIALVVTSACAATRDVYVGSDITDAAPADGRVEMEPDAAEPMPAAGSPEPEPRAGNPAPPPITCGAGTGDCDGSSMNGCEADLLRDANHCGSCAVRCEAPDCGCRDGLRVVVCPAGRADCDGAAANGCEVDTSSSMQHCGACQRACHTDGHDAVTAVCSAGQCQITCQDEAFPEGNCDGDADNGCETSLWSNENCGACGVRCTCLNGRCA